MNKVTHFEIVVIDIQRAIEFYKNVFAWTFEKWEGPGMDMEYWMVMTVPPGTPGAINGGLRKEMGTDVKEKTKSVNGYICTVEVPSIDETLQKVETHGGSILMSKMDVETIGQFASCVDSEGNIFGVIQTE